MTAGHILARLALAFSTLSFIGALLLIQVSASAAPLDRLTTAGQKAWGASAQTSIGAMAGNIILAVLGLLGIIFVVLLTYGGFLWLTARGEEEKTKDATRLITNAIIGLLIVVAAYSIAYFVLQKIGAAIVAP